MKDLINVTLSDNIFKEIVAGNKHKITTKRNPRKDRYFKTKNPSRARINKMLFNIKNIVITDTEIEVYI